ncbi:hypothetical protein NKI79_30450 [Mesorhizobium sp. M0340]|uniref:hypothetical protein n=1 Tax=Mesorhizobium sp. M0340 TaxID=2956939 RepID=UPI003334D457
MWKARLNTIVNLVLQFVGGLFLLAAFLQWITFDYPDVSPYMPFAIFASGMMVQTINYPFVCLLGMIGFVMIGFARRDRQKWPAACDPFLHRGPCRAPDRRRGLAYRRRETCWAWGACLLLASLGRRTHPPQIDAAADVVTLLL